MQIVIDISEELYNHIKNDDVYYLEDGEDLYTAVKNSTPLPKGHGRLIDEKEIDTVVKGVFSGCKCSPRFFLKVINIQCIEAVGADKAESECEE